MSDTQGHKDMALLRNAAIFVGWIAGLILIAGLTWFLTEPARNRFLLKAVNQVLEQYGDSRRLELPVSPGTLKAGVSKMGSWYTMTELPEGSRAFIFTFIGDGSFFPCAALVAPGGKVEEFLPLNSQGQRMMKRISPEILKLYAWRIEGAGS